MPHAHEEVSDVEDSVGFIGLGSMGAPMARRLAGAGHRLVVCDSSHEAARAFGKQGHEVVAAPREVARRCATVFASLPTPSVVRQIALGPDGVIHGERIRIFVDLSTTGPEVEIEVARALAKESIVMVDAPVSGGISGAEKGTLALMVSGTAEPIESVRPLLECMGRIFLVGTRAGEGQTMKVLNNLLAATSLAATAEVLALGQKAGLSAETMLSIINAGTGRNFATENFFPKAFADPAYAAGMNCKLMFKDVRLGLEVADLHEAPLWVGVAVRQLWGLAAAQTPMQDFMRITELAKRNANVS